MTTIALVLPIPGGATTKTLALPAPEGAQGSTRDKVPPVPGGRATPKSQSPPTPVEGRGIL